MESQAALTEGNNNFAIFCNIPYQERYAELCLSHFYSYLTVGDTLANENICMKSHGEGPENHIIGGTLRKVGGA